MNIADFIACSFILEFPFCKSMCIWVGGICWLHFVCLSFHVTFAPVKWLASCIHPFLGCKYICLQCGIHSPSQEATQGRLHLVYALVLNHTYNRNFLMENNFEKVFQDMEIWETIGLWHYPIPGFYLLAQFGLGVLVALGNLVNNSVLMHLSDRDGPSTKDGSSVEGDEKKYELP